VAPPIRSVFFSSYTGLGGGETSLLSLLGALDRAHHEPILVCPRPGQLPKEVNKLGIPVRFVPYHGASLYFVPAIWKRFPAAARMEAVLQDRRPRCVHTDFHSLPYVMPACRTLGIPVIFTCYGWWFSPRPWQRNFYRDGPATILAISQAVKDGFLGTPPRLPPEKVQVLHLGVDIQRFHPRRTEKAHLKQMFSIPPHAPLVTLMGRFQDVKGHDIFLAACRQIADRQPLARFVIAGENVFNTPGEEAFKGRVVELARSDPVLRERVTFAGWVAQPELLLAATDVLVSSSWFESFGMALVEAMASGVPVVSTNVGGPAETVVEGETGFLVPPGQPPLMAQKVLTLLEQEDLREAMGDAGRRRVRNEFSLTRYAERFSKIIESLAAKDDG
jgi:glycosyltransferase involved in cell wall biosynthesis